MGELVHSGDQRRDGLFRRSLSFTKSKQGKYLIIAFVVAAGIALFALAAQARNNDPITNSTKQAQPTGQSQQETKVMKDSKAANEAKQPENTESVQDDGDGSTTQVTVNGESITVPENGSYRRTTDDGTTRTDIKVDNRNQNSTSGNSSSNSSSSKVQVNVQSNSSTESVSN